jgi:uncharacterized membrane protein YbhN (UPF0104 family)
MDWDLLWQRIQWNHLLLVFVSHAFFLILSSLPIPVFLWNKYKHLSIGIVLREVLLSKSASLFIPSLLSEIAFVPLLKRYEIKTIDSLAAAFSLKLISGIIASIVSLIYLVNLANENDSRPYYIVVVLIALVVPFIIIGIPFFRNQTRRIVAFFSQDIVDHLGVISTFFRKNYSVSAVFIVLVISKSLMAFTFSWFVLKMFSTNVPFWSVGAAVSLAAIGGFISIFPRNLVILETSYVILLGEFVNSNQILILAALFNRVVGSIDAVLLYLLARKVFKA